MNSLKMCIDLALTMMWELCIRQNPEATELIDLILCLQKKDPFPGEAPIPEGKLKKFQRGKKFRKVSCKSLTAPYWENFILSVYFSHQVVFQYIYIFKLYFLIGVKMSLSLVLLLIKGQTPIHIWA